MVQSHRLIQYHQLGCPQKPQYHFNQPIPLPPKPDHSHPALHFNRLFRPMDQRPNPNRYLLEEVSYHSNLTRLVSRQMDPLSQKFLNLLDLPQPHQDKELT
jgi:hypothetical protein